jgi:hypothetical protein
MRGVLVRRTKSVSWVFNEVTEVSFVLFHWGGRRDELHDSIGFWVLCLFTTVSLRYDLMCRYVE